MVPKTTLLRTFATLLSPTLGNFTTLWESIADGRNRFSTQSDWYASHNTGLYGLSIVDNLRVFARLFGKELVDSEMHVKVWIGLF